MCNANGKKPIGRRDPVRTSNREGKKPNRPARTIGTQHHLNNTPRAEPSALCSSFLFDRYLIFNCNNKKSPQVLLLNEIKISIEQTNKTRLPNLLGFFKKKVIWCRATTTFSCEISSRAIEESKPRNTKNKDIRKNFRVFVIRKPPKISKH